MHDRKINKILIIKLRGIGDVVLSTVMFDTIINNFPSAQIDFLTEKPNEQFLNPLGFINKVYISDRKKLLKRIKMFFEIRRQKYDLVIDSFSNPTTAQVTKLSRAGYRLGFPYKGRKYAYNYFGPPERDKYHAADLHLELLKAFGLEINNNKLYFGMRDSDIEFSNKFFSDKFLNKNIVIGISPSGGWPSKKCDPEIFAKIADAVASRYRANILIVWGPGDEHDAEVIKSLMKNKPIVAPGTTICQMGALIKNCSFIIANDSGPMHISTAVGTPVLSLHGPTSPKMQGPYGEKHSWIRIEELDCIECNLLVCPKKHECFKELAIEDVLIKTDKIIKKNNIVVQ